MFMMSFQFDTPSSPEVESPSSPQAAYGGGDIDLLACQIQKRRASASMVDSETTPVLPGTIGNELLSPPTKRKVLGTVKKQSGKPDLQDVAIGFIQQLQETRKKPENPHLNYALTIAERLQQINSSKRVTILKHKMDNLIYEAIVEEMPDN